MNNSRKQSNIFLYSLTIIAILVGSVSLFISLRAGSNKIAYVDSGKLVTDYVGMQEARKQFESKASVMQGNLDSLRLEAEELIKNYETTVSSLSKKERLLTEQLIQSKQQQYESYRQAITEKMKSENQQMINNVLEKVNGLLTKYGKDEGYTIIVAATEYGNVAYADQSIDVTETILKKLNDEYKK